MQGLQIPTPDLLSEYTKFTKDSSTDNQTLGKQRIQYFYAKLLAMANNFTTEKTKYGNSKENQRSYLLPPDIRLPKSVRFKLSDTWEPVELIESNDMWNRLVSYDSYSSRPYNYRIMNQNGNLYIEFNPIPDADGTENIELIFEGHHDPLTFPDNYETGTASFTNGSAVVTGSGTTWASSMVRRFIKPDAGLYWYEIKTFTNTTRVELVNNFQEATVSGVDYKIVELMRLPVEYVYTPVFGASQLYWIPNNEKKANYYGGLYKLDEATIRQAYQAKSKGRVMPGRSVTGGNFGNVPRNYPTRAIG